MPNIKLISFCCFYLGTIYIKLILVSIKTDVDGWSLHKTESCHYWVVALLGVDLTYWLGCNLIIWCCSEYDFTLWQELFDLNRWLVVHVFFIVIALRIAHDNLIPGQLPYTLYPSVPFNWDWISPNREPIVAFLCLGWRRDHGPFAGLELKPATLLDNRAHQFAVCLVAVGNVCCGKWKLEPVFLVASALRKY